MEKLRRPPPPAKEIEERLDETLDESALLRKRADEELDKAVAYLQAEVAMLELRRRGPNVWC